MFMRFAVYKKPSNQRNRYFSILTSPFLSNSFLFSPTLHLSCPSNWTRDLVISQTLWDISNLIFVYFHLIASISFLKIIHCYDPLRHSIKMFVKKLVEIAKKVQIQSYFSLTVHLLLRSFWDSMNFFFQISKYWSLPKSMLDPFVRIIFDFFLPGFIKLYIFLWLRYYIRFHWINVYEGVIWWLVFCRIITQILLLVNVTVTLCRFVVSPDV